MKVAAQATRPPCNRVPSATCAVRFTKREQKRPLASQKLLAGRIPRVTRLLALAHRIDAMIRSGEIRDWAEAARIIGVTRARMTQIANLLLLAPDIQEAILTLPVICNGRSPITEQCLRRIEGEVLWAEQRVRWADLLIVKRRHSVACES